MNGELPKSWVWTNLESITYIVLGQSPPSSTYNEAEIGLPFYQGKSEFGLIYPTPTKWCSSPKKIAEKDDILISVRAPVGPTNICPEKSCIGRGLAAIRGLGNINNKFILYLLRNFEEQFRNKATGTTFEAITGNVLRNFELPLPPLAEQQRIVNKIEELFTNLDKGVESLNEVKYKLKIYRQAILKYAMEGKLTAKWREENKDGLEFSPEINSKIKGKIQNEELDDIRKICFIEIPNEWIWSSVGNIGEVFGGKRIPKGYIISDSKTNHPYIRVTDFSNYGVKREGLKYLDNETYNFIKRYIITKNDVYISIAGSIGKVGTIPEDLDNANLTENAARIVSPIYNNRLMAYFLNSEFCQLQISRYTIHTNQPKLALFRIKKLIIPLPPLEEQHIIVERIEQLFSLADYIEETVNSKLEQSKNLRQSILKKAFEGKLVPQDPNDEPAELLLEKIKKQKPNKEKIVQEKLV